MGRRKQSLHSAPVEDDDPVRVLTKNILNNLALIGLRHGHSQPSLRDSIWRRTLHTDSKARCSAAYMYGLKPVPFLGRVNQANLCGFRTGIRVDEAVQHRNYDCDVLGVDGIQSLCDETAVSSTIPGELLLSASGRLLP
jgi:hypothetical protein